MGFNLEKAQRIVWQVKDRLTFFEHMRPLLNLNNEEVEEIKEQLLQRDFDYLEIASYTFAGRDEEPSAALVFDGKKDVYWDIFNSSHSKKILGKIKSIAPKSDQMASQRGLTQRDWKKRLEAIYGLDPASIFDAP